MGLPVELPPAQPAREQGDRSGGGSPSSLSQYAPAPADWVSGSSSHHTFRVPFTLPVSFFPPLSRSHLSEPALLCQISSVLARGLIMRWAPDPTSKPSSAKKETATKGTVCPSPPLSLPFTQSFPPPPLSPSLPSSPLSLFLFTSLSDSLSFCSA